MDPHINNVKSKKVKQWLSPKDKTISLIVLIILAATYVHAVCFFPVQQVGKPPHLALTIFKGIGFALFFIGLLCVIVGHFGLRHPSRGLGYLLIFFAAPIILITLGVAMHWQCGQIYKIAVERYREANSNSYRYIDEEDIPKSALPRSCVLYADHKVWTLVVMLLSSIIATIYTCCSSLHVNPVFLDDKAEEIGPDEAPGRSRDTEVGLQEASPCLT